MGWLRRKRADGTPQPGAFDREDNAGLDILLSRLPEGMGEPVGEPTSPVLRRLEREEAENRWKDGGTADKAQEVREPVPLKVPYADPLYIFSEEGRAAARAEAEKHFTDVGATRVRLIDVGLSDADLWLRVANADGYRMVRVPLSRADMKDGPRAAEPCRICGGSGGKHDGAVHDARAADMPVSPRVIEEGREALRKAVERSEEALCECDRPDQRDNPHRHERDAACALWAAMIDAGWPEYPRDARDAVLDQCAALVRDAYTSVYPSASYPEAARALSYAEQCILAEKRRG